MRTPAPFVIRLARRLGNGLRRGATHVFLLSPPLCGSTVIAQLMRTSPNVTVFPGNGEGQFLPEARSILLVDRRWDPDLEIDWRAVRRIFHSYWSPLRPVRFEKSPPNLVRAEQLQRVFPNARFLLTIRNPYAQIEGLLRRSWPFNEHGPQSSPAPGPTPRAAAAFWVRTARHQRHNAERLRSVCSFRYEDLTERTDETLARLLAFLPELGTLDPSVEFTAHNVTGGAVTGLRNMNDAKIAKLSAAQIAEINAVLCDHADLLAAFGYSLLLAE